MTWLARAGEVTTTSAKAGSSDGIAAEAATRLDGPGLPVDVKATSAASSSMPPARATPTTVARPSPHAAIANRPGRRPPAPGPPTEPRNRVSADVDEDVLRLRVEVERAHAELPADAGHLVAAEWRLGMDRAVRVHADHASLQRLRRAQRLADVAAPDGATEAVRRRVGELQRLLLRVERDDRDHRPEALLLGDPHVVRHAVEDRRQEIRTIGQGRIVRFGAADDDGRAFAEPDLDVVLDPVALLRADERPHLGRVVGRIADLDLARRLHEQLHDALVRRALHEDPAPRAAVLAGVVEDAVGRLARELLEVGIGEDDVRALAAELERDLLHVPGCQPHDLLAGRGLAGERDLADPVVGGDRGACRAAGSRHDVEDARRDARLQ